MQINTPKKNVLFKFLHIKIEKEITPTLRLLPPQPPSP
jgi:hypothetical protein